MGEHIHQQPLTAVDVLPLSQPLDAPPVTLTLQDVAISQVLGGAREDDEAPDESTDPDQTAEADGVLREQILSALAQRYQHDVEVQRQVSQYCMSGTPADLSGDPVQRYQDDLGRYRRLTTDETMELFQRIDLAIQTSLATNAYDVPAFEQATLFADAVAAYQILYACNLRLASDIAHRYWGSGVPPEDIIGYSTVGLGRAIARFNRDAGFLFSTYAPYWMRHDIHRGLLEAGRLVHINHDTNSRIRRLNRQTALLWQRLNREPNVEEIAENLQITVAQACFLMQVASLEPMLSLSTPTIAEDEGSISLGDAIPDISQAPVDAVDTFDAIIVMQRALAAVELTKTQWEAISLRYGFADGTTRLLEEVADILGITKQAVAYRERGAINKYRRHFGLPPLAEQKKNRSS